MNLTDTFTLDDVRRTSDGYVAAFARVARTGIQVYRGSELGRPELDKVRVYRPPAEVFSADALRSFAHRPITLRHPPVPVTAKNWKKYSGGQTGDEVVRDGEFVRVPMLMMDAGLIDAYEREGVKELSMGYSTDIKWHTGVVDAGQPDAGQQYDAVQTAIRANHLAVVPVARGGDQLRIGDAATKTCPECGATVDASEEECPECGYEFETNTNDEGDYPMKLVIDGVPVSVADDQSGAIIERHITKLAGDLKTITDAFEDFKKKAKDKADEDDKKVKDASTAVQTKDGEIAVLKKQVTDAAITPAKLDELVKDRMAVIDAASVVLPKEFVFDGRTLADIRKAVVELKLGDAAKTLSEAAVEGAFAAIVASDKGDGGTRPIRDALLGRKPGGAANTTQAADAAYEASRKVLENNWKTPTAA